MIKKIFSDLPTFKELEFRRGLNILLADKQPDSTNRQTRNRAGKSSTIDVIHFIFGGKCGTDSIFKQLPLMEYGFGLEFEINGAPIVAQRSGGTPSSISVDGKMERWLHQPQSKDGEHLISNTNWRSVLGNLVFGLEENISREPWRPTFRSLFSYFARRDLAGAFQDHRKQAGQQTIGDQQIALSFLIGTDWKISQDFQKVREKEKQLKTLKKAFKDGTLQPAIETTAAIRTKLIVTSRKAATLKEALDSFKVLDEYNELEHEASRITRKLGDLSDDNIIDKRFVVDLHAAIDDERPPNPENLGELYREAGVVFPDAAIKRFRDVQRFHESVIANRRSYLTSEISEAEHRISEREKRKRKLDERRAEIMNLLKASGALENYYELQSEYGKATSEIETLKKRFDDAETLDSEKIELRLERTRLQERLRQDTREQNKTVEHAILVFEEISQALYEDAGSLTIDDSDNGPIFDIRIQGKKSKGIGNMQIFCFDLMLARLCAERNIGPGFLVHDSHLFDGVDERQVGKALELGAAFSDKFGFQYIVTLNSDSIPSSLSESFDFNRFVIPVRLTDSTEDGGLFGIRFS
jgi:uncharacterized protein YydD (DUF2326 family)